MALATIFRLTPITIMYFTILQNGMLALVTQKNLLATMFTDRYKATFFRFPHRIDIFAIAMRTDLYGFIIDIAIFQLHADSSNKFKYLKT
jgi:hypothetical protein